MKRIGVSALLFGILVLASGGCADQPAQLKPPHFEVSQLLLEPVESRPGESVTATVVVSNVGEEQGTYDVKLTVDGSTVETKSITLLGGESTTVSFEIIREAEGHYTVEIGGLTGSFEVRAPTPAEFELSELVVKPAECLPGEVVTATVVVSNVGEEQGTYDVELTVDGSTVETKSITLLGGESTTVSFEIIREAEGHYTVEIGGLTSSFEVRAPTPAEFELSELVVEPAECLPGEVVTATVIVSNVGDEQGTYDVELIVDGSIAETKSVTLLGGESTTVSFGITRETEGHYTVEVGGLTATFEVTIFWGLDDRPYLLVGRQVPTGLASALLGGGRLGGSMQHVYDRLGTYIDSIAGVDSVLLFNAAAEDPELLRQWPAEYSFLFPFDLEELYELELPFGYFKQDEGGYLRGVIMADNEEDLVNLGVHLTEHKIPVGQPYMLTTEGDVTAQIRHLIRGFWGPGDIETEGEELKSVGDRPYLLVGRQIPFDLASALLGGGLLGGSMQHIYDHLDIYIDQIARVDSVLLFNTAAEDPELLRDWPEEYSFLFPFELEELYELKLPFGYFKRDELGYLRGVIMADNEEDLINLGVHLTEHKIPVGQPYTVTTNGDITLEIRNLIRVFWDSEDVTVLTVQQHRIAAAYTAYPRTITGEVFLGRGTGQSHRDPISTRRITGQTLRPQIAEVT